MKTITLKTVNTDKLNLSMELHIDDEAKEIAVHIHHYNKQTGVVNGYDYPASEYAEALARFDRLYETGVDTLREKLLEKLRREQKEFISVTKQLTPAEIIERAYEIAWKEEILDVFRNKPLSDEDMKTILECDDLLDELYDAWLNTDGDYLELLEIAIDRRIKTLKSGGKRLRATNILWDVDYDNNEISLPTEIDIPEGMTDEDDISDYLSEVTGYCHEGFVLEEVDE